MENFDWKYGVDVHDPQSGKLKQVSKEIKDIEAIYINPKWRPSKVGEFLTKPGDGDKKRKLSQKMYQTMGRNFDPKKDLMTVPKEHDSSDDEELRQQIAKSQ